MAASDNGARAMKILAWVGATVGGLAIAGGIVDWRTGRDKANANGEAIIVLQQTLLRQTEITNDRLTVVSAEVRGLRDDLKALATDGVLRKNFEDWVRTFRQLNPALSVPDLPR